MPKEYNPRYEDDFVAGRDYDPDRQRANVKKMQRQMVKEKRGAVRELRKDAAFMAQVGLGGGPWGWALGAAFMAQVGLGGGPWGMHSWHRWALGVGLGGCIHGTGGPWGWALGVGLGGCIHGTGGPWGWALGVGLGGCIHGTGGPWGWALGVGLGGCIHGTGGPWGWALGAAFMAQVGLGGLTVHFGVWWEGCSFCMGTGGSGWGVMGLLVPGVANTQPCRCLCLEHHYRPHTHPGGRVVVFCVACFLWEPGICSGPFVSHFCW